MIEKKQFAVLDLGTNTFHILIVVRDDSNLGFVEIYRKRHYVLLAEDGIETIGQKSINRAIKAIDDFASIIHFYNIDDIQIIGTEALRSASNGSVIADYVHQKIEYVPHIITGEREAYLIYKGINKLAPPDLYPYLIMDIGGGSTEFILVDESGVVFSQSYKLGVSSMYNRFGVQDPLSIQSIRSIEDYMDDQLLDLTKKINEYNIKGLVGASGSFEVLASIIVGNSPSDRLLNISILEFSEVVERIIYSSATQRNGVNGIPVNRVKLIPIAFAMMRKVVSLYSPQSIQVSPFAIKEGVIAEWIDS